MVKTTSRGPDRGSWEVSWLMCLGLPHFKVASRAFPWAVVFTTGREVAREAVLDPRPSPMGRESPSWVTALGEDFRGCFRVLLKDPWLVLGESYLDF
uniref:Uncharacterized protein n=1 Tax=Solanum tuberosum TaxID=4113 RepID=M1DJ28_SOLTU